MGQLLAPKIYVKTDENIVLTILHSKICLSKPFLFGLENKVFLNNYASLSRSLQLDMQAI